ncbi:protein phosphatase 2C domain-containing protein [Streptomyces griseus]|uniref:protein phosphatase 2C domain-containing protein n=1 Tax=Streptomyces griseus TaxID=1911 RepID=UPI00084093BE|nr:protein phosphatase 2C domain-containing protein [Streptomyces griseus]
MSQQGEKPAAHEDDWWRRLYDGTAPDTGPGSAADSVDDRFDSASDAVGRASDAVEPAEGAVGRVSDAVEPAEGAVGRVSDAVEPAEGAVGRARDAGSPAAEHPVAATPVPDPRAPEAVRRPPHGAPDAPAAPEPSPVSPGPPAPAPEPTVGLPALPPQPAPPKPPQPVPPRPPEPPEPPRAVPEPPPVAPEPSVSSASRGSSEDPPQPSSGHTPEPPRAAHGPQPPAAAPDTREPPSGPPSASSARPMPVSAPWEPPSGSPRRRTFAVPLKPARPPAGPPSRTDGTPEPSRPVVGHIGDRPPPYDPEPTALPASEAEDLDGLVPDTVLDGARYGTCSLRAASVRGDSARFRGEPRRDALLTARFGTGDSALLLIAVASGARAAVHAHLAAADACRWIAGAVARSHARLCDDIRAGRRGDLTSGLHRLTDRTYGRLRARAAELGLEPNAYTSGLRCLLLPADPECRTRVFFGVGAGGLFRLRDGAWQDLDPLVPEDSGPAARHEAGSAGDPLTTDLQTTTPPSPYAGGPPPPPAESFRFRASVARPGDTLLLCGDGMAAPLRGRPALADELARRWAAGGPPGLAAYLADTQLRAEGYADDRTSAAVWEA